MMKDKSYEKQKERCCSFYDRIIIPRYTNEMEQREECAELLDDFLLEEEITYEEFDHYIRDYSFGFGLDYLNGVNELIPNLYPLMDYDEQDT